MLTPTLIWEVACSALADGLIARVSVSVVVPGMVDDLV